MVIVMIIILAMVIAIINILIANRSRELRGSQGMGVISNNWFDGVVLPILYMLKPSCRPVFNPPSLVLF